MSSYSSYSLMSVNMNGKTKPDERRALLSKIITSRRSSLVFCQELPDCFEKDVVRKCGTCVYDFVRTGKEAAVMWSEAHFYGEPVDVAFKTRILDTVVASKNFFSHVSEITARTAVVKLTSKSEACSFLAVSWHGPSKMRLEKKREVLKALIPFLYEICLKTNVSSIIIGGDFNLNTSDENGLGELNVYFPWYELSPRGKLAKKRKGQGRPYIAHKDNFAITTISPSVGRPFVDMKLSKVKPLSEFNYVKEEGSERGKDILDHDPIIGVLHLGKTPSTGYSIMTVNMNGHTNAQERRDLLSKIISEGSSLVFCQELPGFFQRDVVPDKYDCVKTENQAAVMWSKEDFDGETVDAGFKTKIFDTPPDTLKEIDAKILSEIPGRTAVVKLTAKEEEANFPKPPFLAVSWHAPHSGKKSWTLKKKQEALKGLILFLYEVCRQKDVSLIIIGGDFNLNTLEENGLEELNVHFQSYELSGRATARKEDRKNYISYKDNFAITTTSSSGAHSLEDMKLSEVKPLLEFVYVKEGEGENGEDIDILDHDPIIGVLQLGKTPSTGESEVAVNKQGQEVDGLAQSLADQLSLTSTDKEDEEKEEEEEEEEEEKEEEEEEEEEKKENEEEEEEKEEEEEEEEKEEKKENEEEEEEKEEEEEEEEKEEKKENEEEEEE